MEGASRVASVEDPSGEVTLGLSISLAGRFEAQGRQAARGLQLWVAQVNNAGGLTLRAGRRRVRLILSDDASRTDSALRNVERLLTEERVDILIGPYSSGLTMAVAPLALAHGKLLWNHGGTSDALFDRGWPHLVSIGQLASTYFRSLPGLLRQVEPSVRKITVVHSRRGTFASSVARGLSEAACATGIELSRIIFDSPIHAAGRFVEQVLAENPECLVFAGSYESDVALVRASALTRRPRVLAAVAAGVYAFGRDLGPLSEGVIGPSQWEPELRVNPTIGPSSEAFLTAFHSTYQQEPDYTSAQAYALGLILGRCVEQIGAVDDGGLLSVVPTLDVTTFFGRFRLDPVTRRQIGHRGCLIRWTAGRKAILSEAGVE